MTPETVGFLRISCSAFGGLLLAWHEWAGSRTRPLLQLQISLSRPLFFLGQTSVESMSRPADRTPHANLDGQEALNPPVASMSAVRSAHLSALGDISCKHMNAFNIQVRLPTILSAPSVRDVLKNPYLHRPDHVVVLVMLIDFLIFTPQLVGS